jgi:hypothetical protein
MNHRFNLALEQYRAEGASDQEALFCMTTKQEALQMGIESDEPAMLSEAARLDKVGVAMAEEVASRSDAVVALESLVGFIQGRNLSAESKTFAGISLESYMQKAGITSPVYVSMEDEGGSPGLLQRAKDGIAEVYDFLRRRVAAMARHIAQVMGVHARNLRRLNNRIQEVEELLGKVTKGEPLSPVIKAEGWCEYLCYLKTGFVPELEGVPEAVVELVTQHRQMASSTLGKHLDFLTSLSQGPTSDAAFQSLQLNHQEFLLPEMEQFHRSVEFESPRGSNVFFRTKELPGGKALYVQVNPTNQRGVDAIEMLQDVDYTFNQYDPKSYTVFRAKLLAATLIPVSALLTVVNPLLGVVAGVASGALLANQGVENTGRKITIDKTVVFTCLGIDRIKAVLRMVRQGLNELKGWSEDVLIGPWKSRDLDEVVDKILDEKTSTSSIKAYCNAVLSLMSKLGGGIHTYSFRVLGACLNFCEKSVRQYL